MTVLLFGLFLAASLLNIWIMHGAIVWSLLAAAIAFALLVLNLLPGKLLPRKIIRSLSVAGVVLLLLIGLWSGMKTSSAAYLGYDAAVAHVEEMLFDGKYAQADELLDQLIQDYGANDQLQLYKAKAAMGQADYAGVDNYLSLTANKSSDQFYLIRGQAYEQAGLYDQAQDTFVRAASQYPLWREMQLFAGIQAVNNQDYAVGEYFLRRAFEQDPTEAVPLYYLGVIRYDQGLYTEAEDYFTEALDIGIESKITSYISWYRQQMGDEQP